MKSHGLPGVAGYAMLLLWFLLTVLAARSAQAAEAGALTAADVLPAIEAALMENGASPAAAITLADPGAALALAAGAEPQVEHVSFNPATGRFVVRISGTAVAGFAKTSTLYPVLLSGLSRGDIISEADIGWIETADARPDTIVSAETLLGMEARRSLDAGAPLRKSDIVAPVLVRRGALVTMTYSMTGLTLSEAAIAQATGSKGDVVEVKNVKSDRVIRAVVEGKDRVRVLSSRIAQMEPRQ